MIETIQDRLKQLTAQANEVYQRANESSGGLLEILSVAFRRFNQAKAADGAATIAYYTLFSLFPLLLGLVALGGIFLERAEIYAQVVRWIHLVIPIEADSILENIQDVLRERGTIGIVGAVGLVWSATAMFIALFRNINRAWSQAEPLNTLRSRLIAMGLIFSLVLVLLITLFASAIINVLSSLRIPDLSLIPLFEPIQWLILANFLPWLVTLIAFLILYRLIPNTKVRWSEAFWGALVAATGWEITTRLFTWYLSSGLAQYRLIYGALGSIVAFIFWVYINSLIVIFGAHLCAAIAYKTRYIE